MKDELSALIPQVGLHAALHLICAVSLLLMKDELSALIPQVGLHAALHLT